MLTPKHPHTNSALFFIIVHMIVTDIIQKQKLTFEIALVDKG